MANWEGINNSFSQRLSNLWAETPIAWDNAIYNPTTDTSWVRATLVPSYTENNALATSVIHYGIFWVQIFVSLNKGTSEAYRLASMLEPLFSNVEFDEVVCYAAETSRTGDEGNGWYQLNVRANFWSNERVS